MSRGRRLAFARARTAVGVALKGGAGAQSALNVEGGTRRRVFDRARNLRRAAPRAALPARGYEDLH